MPCGSLSRPERRPTDRATGLTPASSFTVNSATSITAVAPAGSAGTLDITVTTPISTSPITARDHFKLLPSVESVAPASGPVAGGNIVTITGSGFATAPGATTIKFADKRSLVVSCSSTTTCTATAPAHEAGSVAVVVTANSLTSAASAGDLYSYG